jgi:hypothetical protein
MASNHPPIFFFCNTVRVVVDADQLTGAQIKAEAKRVIPTLDLGHDLVLEAQGHGEDRQIPDEESVSLTHGHGEGPKHFFTRPPTNFGCA